MISFKKNTFVALIVITFATSFAPAVQAGKKLVFFCDEQQRILGCGKFRGMKFGISRKKLMGQYFTSKLELSQSIKDRIAQAFEKAAKSKKERFVKYEADEKNYKTVISPLDMLDKTVCYMVKVTEIAEEKGDGENLY